MRGWPLGPRPLNEMFLVISCQQQVSILCHLATRNYVFHFLRNFNVGNPPLFQRKNIPILHLWRDLNHISWPQENNNWTPLVTLLHLLSQNQTARSQVVGPGQGNLRWIEQQELGVEPPVKAGMPVGGRGSPVEMGLIDMIK